MNRLITLLIVAGICNCLGSKVSSPVVDKFFEDAQETQTLLAGSQKINGTLPIGTPLAGYNHAQRRVPFWPVPEFLQYTTFMTPSVGIIDPTWVKAVVLDNSVTQIAFITLDGIGSDGSLNQLAWDIATGLGFTVPFENCLFSSSHSHSGPGAVSSDMLWALAPATDLFVPELHRALATSTAQAMFQAQQNKQPAVIDIGMSQLVGVTQNRRAGISHFVNKNSIDPHLGVIRVDSTSGKPIATIWNFAIHGVCYGPENMKFSGDIMGKACQYIEESVGGIALFINGDAGDIDPADGMCDGAPEFKGSALMADAVEKLRSSLNPTSQIEINAISQLVDFGPTNLNATLQRFSNCTHGGPIDICTFCAFFRCDLNLHLYSAWIQNVPRFTAFSFVVNNKKIVTVSMPGEALLELGWWIRNDTQALGFDLTFLTGYSNNHMGYFATPDEYDIGGYESQLTLWGIDTASRIRSGCKSVASNVIPNVL